MDRKTPPPLTIFHRLHQSDPELRSKIREEQNMEFKLKIAGQKVGMKDRRAERKNEAEDRRRLEQKYRPLRGTPCWLLEHIENPQEQYARDGSDDFIKVARECGNRVSHSIYGPWLTLTRLNHPRRPKDAVKPVKEYMEVPLAEDGVYGDWKPMDGNAQSEPKPLLSPLPLPLLKRKGEEIETGTPVKRRAMSEPPASNSKVTPQRAGSQPPQNHQPQPNPILLLEIDTLRQTFTDARSSVLPDFDTLRA